MGYLYILTSSTTGLMEWQVIRCSWISAYNHELFTFFRNIPIEKNITIFNSKMQHYKNDDRLLSNRSLI